MGWAKLQSTPGVTLFAPRNSTLESLPVRLPTAHLDLLRMTDGLVAADGFVRLFGVGDSVRDQTWWNSNDCWRFAWRQNCKGYWFFAEQACGAQYAYEVDADGTANGRVIYFSPITMAPAWTLPDFETFFENVAIRRGAMQMDSMYQKAVNRFGIVPASKHISMIPHPCLGGDMETGDVMLLEARTAMIMNADLWRAVNELKEGETATRMDTYQDEMGRMRFRLVVDQSISPVGAE